MVFFLTVDLFWEEKGEKQFSRAQEKIQPLSIAQEIPLEAEEVWDPP